MSRISKSILSECSEMVFVFFTRSAFGDRFSLIRSESGTQGGMVEWGPNWQHSNVEGKYLSTFEGFQRQLIQNKK